MSFKYLGLNALLCFVILLIAIKNYETWNHSTELLPDTEIAPKKSETKNENPPMMASTKEPISIQSSNLISEKNIFSPERKDFPTTPLEKSKPILRPQVILYGVAIATDYQSATVVNPGRPLRKEERETLTIKIGERIGGYKLAKILPDRIAMESNGDTFEVLLYDSRSPKKRMEVKTEVRPPTVTITQPAPAPPPAAEAPKPPASPVSAEKPKEPVQQQVVPPTPTPTPRPIPPLFQRRGRRPVYMPPSTSTSETGGS